MPRLLLAIVATLIGCTAGLGIKSRSRARQNFMPLVAASPEEEWDRKAQEVRLFALACVAGFEDGSTYDVPLGSEIGAAPAPSPN